MSALLLARRRDLHWTIRDTYEYCGIAHFLALSGLHLGIIAVPIVCFLSVTRLPAALRHGLLLTILFVYAAVADFPPSLVRALSLMAAVLFHRALGLRSGLVRSLILGGIAVAAVSWSTMMEPGYRLSFAAVCGIALIGLPPVRAIGRRLPSGKRYAAMRIVLLSTMITVSIQLFTLPLILAWFGRAALIAPVMNLLMMIPVSLFLYAGAAYLVFPVEPLRAVLAPVLDFLSSLLRDVPAALSRNPRPALLSGDIEPALYAAGICLLAAALAKRCTRRRFVIAASIIFLVVSGAAGNRGIPAGAGAVLDVADTGVLVDCGSIILYFERDTSRYDGRSTVRDLWKRGIGRIDILIIGTGGGERRGGIRHLLQRIEVGEIICSPYLVRSRGDIIRAAQRIGVPLRIVSAGDTVACGECSIEITAPEFPPLRGTAVPEDASLLRCMVRVNIRSDAHRPVVLPRRAVDRVSGATAKTSRDGS